MTKNKRLMHPIWIVAHRLFRNYRLLLFVYSLIFLSIFLLINISYSTGLISNPSTTMPEIWDSVSISPNIFLLVLGIMITTLTLSGFVSNGLTRRHFVAGTTLFMLAMSLAFSIIMLIGYPLGNLTLQAFGVPWDLQYPHLLSMILNNIFIFFGYFSTGWLIGSTFYRFNWKVAAPLALISYMPAIGMEWIIEIDNMPYFIKIVILVVVSALIVALNYVMLRRVSIKRKLV
ncbi:hypothetical protein I6N90_19535 [Paenibacillus sp. GSMTC-2017]|uniref:hypothetical protein n=1 Tax=Paenibacillus sp. GSMTC-2017 TaxID=2794350 RepID=UPI0018D82903|nr:hypothetical protein [Paenibacillus sp. GSMTC-2017]MBH5319997.1 hypothetical protein [Paenibacillus sp. GSMTC-2017]